MALQDRIREQRKQKGFSQEKVAEHLGVSRQAVAKWESGKSVPSTEHLIRLAELYETTVDALVVPEVNQQSMSEEKTVGPFLQIQSRHIQWKRTLGRVLAVLTGYAVIYLAGRIFGTTAECTSILGWLFGTSPQQHTYLYGWLLHQNLFWFAMAISVIAAIVGRPWAAGVTMAGFGIGLLLGELFGSNPAGAFYGKTHYGWAIWAGIYLLFLVAGMILEHIARKGLSWRSRPFGIWATGVTLGVILVVLLVRSSFV